MNWNNRNLSENESSGKKKSFFLKLIGPWTFLILAVAAVVFLFFRAQDEVRDTPRERPPVAVETAPVTGLTLTDTIRAVGTLRPVQRVDIKPEVDGRIKKTYFQEGSFVSENKILFEIEEEKHVHRLASSEAALEQSRSRLENLRRSFERYRNLFEQELISESDFDRVKTDLETVSAEVRRLEAQVELSREDLGDTVLRAPFSGYISRRLADPGAFVSSGQVLASMYQTDPLEISLMLPEKYSARADLGQIVLIEVAAHPAERFNGVVSYLSPSVEESTRSFEVRASIDNSENRLRPGSFASATLIIGHREASAVIPDKALTGTRDGYLVFILDEDMERVEIRLVEIGARRPGVVEILEGLSPGDQVIVSGHMSLNPGTRVTVAEEMGSDWTKEIEHLWQSDLPDPEKMSSNQLEVKTK